MRLNYTLNKKLGIIKTLLVISDLRRDDPTDFECPDRI